MAEATSARTWQKRGVATDTLKPRVRKAGESTGAGMGQRRVGAGESRDFYTHRLALLNRLLARDTRLMLEPFGLSQMEWRILIQLEQASPAKISEISTRSLLQKPQLSLALPPLIAKGCVTRESDPDDRRAPYFAITEKGLSLYRSVMREARKRQRRFESLLDSDQRRHFSAAVGALISALAVTSGE
jgi:DNA-binding MarR family transcriptional regulator